MTMLLWMILRNIIRWNCSLDKSNYNSVDVVQSSNYFEIFIFGLLAGFLALLTPCIFPMIPLTVSYFIDQEKVKI